MKNFILLLSVFSFFYLTSCDKTEDIDPNKADADTAVLGIWENVTEATVNDQTISSVWKWTFNDDYSGKYSYVSNSEIKEESAFIWAKKDSAIFTVDYTLEDLEDVEVYVADFLGETALISTDDKILGIKAE